MTRLWGWILHGCWHRWALVRTVTLYGDGFGGMTDLPTGRRVECECTRYGRWKAWRL